MSLRFRLASRLLTSSHLGSKKSTDRVPKTSNRGAKPLLDQQMGSRGEGRILRARCVTNGFLDHSPLRVAGFLPNYTQKAHE